MKEQKLSYEEAMASPCQTCRSSPCCSMLQLDVLTTIGLMELDKINFYLNFDNIEILLTEGWEWNIYYHYPCRYYGPGESKCRIHDTGQQPGVCIHYNPYSCFYKKLDRARHNPGRGMIWINRERLDFLLSQISFAEDRKIAEIPETAKLHEPLSRIPYRVPHQVTVPGEGEPTISAKKAVKSHVDLQNPCQECDAYCCRSLMLPQSKPLTYTSLDFNRYALCFPGIELGISDDTWYIVAQTRCRHLEDSGCAVYDKEERPLVCRYYNARQCAHKACFEKASPNGFMRVGYEEFDRLMETFKFDEDGNIIADYGVNSLREHLSASR